jgi:peptidoglycan/xylan/chitin deacetylase (PgdA/CDA1 family)
MGVHELGMKRLLAIADSSHLNYPSVGKILSDIISKMSFGEIEALKARILNALGTHQRELHQSGIFLSCEDIPRLHSYGITVGNHSMSHCYFRSLTAEELDREIIQSRLVLERLSGRLVRSLSIPYGNHLDATPEARKVARAGGHDLVFLVHARSNRFRRDCDSYYRVSLRNERAPEMPMMIRFLPVLRSIRSLVVQ